MTIEVEISKFWKWPKISPDEYSLQRGLGELETECPNWDEFNISIDATNSSLNETYNFKLAEYLIQALAIDNESELTLAKIEDKLIKKEKLISQIIDSGQSQAKWQIAELIGNIEIKNSIQYLTKLIEDKDKYVQRRVLLSLNRINKDQAKTQANQFINDSDEYLKMVSINIINE